MNNLLNRLLFFSNIPSLPTYVSSYDSPVSPLVMSLFFTTVPSMHFLCTTLGLFMVCLLCIHVSSYDCSQFAYLCLIVWLFTVCPLLMSHLMTVPSLSASYDSSYDCPRSAYLCLILWPFMVHPLLMPHLMTIPGLFPLPVCLPVMSHRMTVPSLSTSGDCSQSHLMVIPCACVHAIFSRLGVCTVSEVQVDLRCDY